MNNIKENIINKMKSHSHEILELQKEYLSLQAKASFLKDKTEAIKLKILSESEFFAEDTLERILTITDDFTMSNNDFKTYYSLVREDQDKIGIAHENPKYCSQLVAENDLREHETKIFKFILTCLPNGMAELLDRNEYKCKHNIITLFMKLENSI